MTLPCPNDPIEKYYDTDTLALLGHQCQNHSVFLHFFSELRRARVPVSIREYLTLLEGIEKDVADESLDGFYYLARTALVKDERDLDKFDQVFSHVFRGLDYLGDICLLYTSPSPRDS